MRTATEDDPFSKVKARNYTIAAAVATLPAVNAYIGSLCRRMHSIYRRYGLDVTEMAPETCKSGMGQVQTRDIAGVLDSGNLRERMTLLTNISGGRNQFIWRIMQDAQTAPGVNRSVLRSRMHRAYLMTGLSDIGALARFTDESPDGDMPNRILDFSVDGPVILSRLDPSPLRSPRPAENRAAHRIPHDHVFPGLSAAELSYIRKHNADWDPAFMPWETGLMVWVINPENFYSRLATRQGQEVITGPSGHAGGVLGLAELFSDFDVELTVLACAFFLCGAHHHSAWEVLLSAIPFGLPYTSETDAYAYVHYLVTKHRGSAPPGQSGAGADSPG